MHLNEIIETLKTDCGTGDLTPDENGVYSLVHEGTSVLIFPFDDGAKALLYTAVTQVPETGSGELAQVVLQVNHEYKGGNGASFSVDPESNRFCLQQFVDCETLGYEGFSLALLNLIEQAKLWKTKIDQFESVHSDLESGATASETVEIPNNWLSI